MPPSRCHLGQEVLLQPVLLGPEVGGEGLGAAHVLEDGGAEVLSLYIALAEPLEDNLAKVREVDETFPGDQDGNDAVEADEN